MDSALILAAKPAAPAGIDWNAWTAIGTLALAAMTLAAVVTTIVVTTQDRRRADQQHQREIDREQDAQAWAIEIVPGSWMGSESGTRTLSAAVTNLGDYTITRVEARFSLGGQSLLQASKIRRPEDDARVPMGAPGADIEYGPAYGGILTRGTSLKFWSDSIDRQHLSSRARTGEAGEIESSLMILGCVVHAAIPAERVRSQTAAW